WQGGGAAYTRHRTSFEYAEQVGLKAERHLGDFVQEQRTARGLFKQAGAACKRASECTFLVTKEFAADQLARECAAVGSEKGTFTTAGVMDGTRHHFLTHAAFTKQHDVGT